MCKLLKNLGAKLFDSKMLLLFELTQIWKFLAMKLHENDFIKNKFTVFNRLVLLNDVWQNLKKYNLCDLIRLRVLQLSTSTNQIFLL